jgi:hypothetical protein
MSSHKGVDSISDRSRCRNPISGRLLLGHGRRLRSSRGRGVGGAAKRRRDLEVAGLDLLGQLVEPALLLDGLPGRAARVEDVVHLLERVALGLGGHEGHVDKGGAVEGREDHVHLPVDVPQQGRDAEGQDHVPEPVRGGRERHGLGAHFAGEDLGRVGPGRGTPGRGEGRDEEVRAGNDGRGDRFVVHHDPGDVAVLSVLCCLIVGSTIDSL